MCQECWSSLQPRRNGACSAGVDAFFRKCSFIAGKPAAPLAVASLRSPECWSSLQPKRIGACSAGVDAFFNKALPYRRQAGSAFGGGEPPQSGGLQKKGGPQAAFR